MEKPELFSGDIQMHVRELMEWQEATKVDYKILTAMIRDAQRAHDKWIDKMVEVGKPVNFFDVCDEQKQNNVMTENAKDAKRKKACQNLNRSLKIKKL